MEKNLPVHRRVKRYILEQNIQIVELAEKSGIPVKRLYPVLAGTGRMRLEEYENICHALNVDTNFFMPLKS